jgi:anaerobic selenocysteine-containing dehydrogenase
MGMRAVCSLAAVLGHARAVHYESFGAFALAEHAIERPDLRGSPSHVVPHVQLGRELESGRYGALFVWGHNPVVVCPDAARVRTGMLRPDVFSVVHEQFLTETAKLADVVLPATMFPEHADVYRSFGHRRLQWAPAACTPPPGPRSNVAAFAAIARALGLPRACHDVTPESLCEELLAASHARLAPGDRERLRAGAPVRIAPPAPPDGKQWDTPSGKIELVSAACARAGRPSMATWQPDVVGESGAFWLVAAPSVHTHNSTFHHGPRHVKRAGKPRCCVHPADLRELGLAPGALLTLQNRRGRISLQADEDDSLPRGRVRVDGLPRAADVPEGVGINALVSSDLSDMGDGNVLYSTRVDLAPYSR